MPTLNAVLWVCVSNPIGFKFSHYTDLQGNLCSLPCFQFSRVEDDIAFWLAHRVVFKSRRAQHSRRFIWSSESTSTTVGFKVPGTCSGLVPVVSYLYGLLFYLFLPHEAGDGDSTGFLKHYHKVVLRAHRTKTHPSERTKVPMAPLWMRRRCVGADLAPLPPSPGGGRRSNWT